MSSNFMEVDLKGPLRGIMNAWTLRTYMIMTISTLFCAGLFTHGNYRLLSSLSLVINDIRYVEDDAALIRTLVRSSAKIQYVDRR